MGDKSPKNKEKKKKKQVDNRDKKKKAPPISALQVDKLTGQGFATPARNYVPALLLEAWIGIQVY